MPSRRVPSNDAYTFGDDSLAIIDRLAQSSQELFDQMKNKSLPQSSFLFGGDSHG